VSEWVSVSTAALHESLVRYLSTEGLTEEHAGWAADYLVDTERSGVRTHGIAHLASYVRLLRAGIITAQPELRVVSQRDSVLTLDGGNGLGQVVGTWMMGLAAERARESGVVLVSVKHANHLGALGYYLRMPVLDGLGGLLCQVSAPMMLSAGAIEPRLGNNPLAMAVPGADGQPAMVLDISCSQTSRSRIRQAMRTGEPIPPTWALGPDGTPALTATDAFAGALLPIAGHKGAGLATMVGALAGVLTGGAFGEHVTFPDDAVAPRNIGYFLVLFDVAAVMDPLEYSTRMSEYVDYLVSAPTAPDADPVTVPGQRSARNRAASVETLQLVAGQWADLEKRLRGSGISVPDVILN
jgi:LDH2 family malate/lactate/ureidoglycolate dehydrogenase